MVKVNFYELNSIQDNKLKFAVMMTKFNGQWIYVRHKDRNTWEIPGGHREESENINDTASRELFEETGATKFQLTPICIYSVEREENVNYTESFGQLFYSEVDTLDTVLHFEISEIKLFDDIPDNLTYPLIQPFLHKKVLEFLNKM
ncbi:8-oxo-dGTP diphosphatase [Clostridium acidisoli DSM 12555]|jgi:8-oxo-dGTP diphosphatase|uniref:8-oxo-dGTP diphosphatase n=1 Tax=Clostridium acidisoli DSM 12555 TaxID=1121291 RepID=A0A1W1X3N4_9CLOT|nr:NUDIX domain-containing protein [Clostridium acidisoli]SMC18443.1 8-oxo-dGTP diphosphatase [Clostridium acidisoli DSM 12555]